MSTYYRLEIEGYGTLFRDIDDILNIFITKYGRIHPEFENLGLEEYIEDINSSFNYIESILPIPQLNFNKFNYRSVFTEYGYNYFLESLLDIEYSLRALGFNLEIFKVNLNDRDIIYRDKYQALYLK